MWTYKSINNKKDVKLLNDKRLNLRISEDIYYNIKKISEDKNLSMNSLINSVLSDFIINEYCYSYQNKNKEVLESIGEIIKENNNLLDRLNTWHEINAEQFNVFIEELTRQN
mgnify:CR=1 FL=1